MDQGCMAGPSGPAWEGRPRPQAKSLKRSLMIEFSSQNEE